MSDPSFRRRIRRLTRSLTTARRVAKNPPPGVDCRRSGYALPPWTAAPAEGWGRY